MQNTYASSTQSNIQLRVNAYVRGVYNWMAVGLALTGVVAYFVANNPAVYNVVRQGFIVFAIAEIGMVFMLSARIQKLKATTATALFMIYAASQWSDTLTAINALCQNNHCSGIFCMCCLIPCPEYLWLDNKKGLDRLWQFLIYGTHRNRHRIPWSICFYIAME